MAPGRRATTCGLIAPRAYEHGHLADPRRLRSASVCPRGEGVEWDDSFLRQVHGQASKGKSMRELLET